MRTFGAPVRRPQRLDRRELSRSGPSRRAAARPRTAGRGWAERTVNHIRSLCFPWSAGCRDAVSGRALFVVLAESRRRSSSQSEKSQQSRRRRAARRRSRRRTPTGRWWNEERCLRGVDDVLLDTAVDTVVRYPPCWRNNYVQLRSTCCNMLPGGRDRARRGRDSVAGRQERAEDGLHDRPAEVALEVGGARRHPGAPDQAPSRSASARPACRRTRRRSPTNAYPSPTCRYATSSFQSRSIVRKPSSRTRSRGAA